MHYTHYPLTTEWTLFCFAWLYRLWPNDNNDNKKSDKWIYSKRNSLWFGFVCACIKRMPAVASVCFILVILCLVLFWLILLPIMICKKKFGNFYWPINGCRPPFDCTSLPYIYTDANGQKEWVCISMSVYWAMFCTNNIKHTNTLRVREKITTYVSYGVHTVYIGVIMVHVYVYNDCQLCTYC